MWFSRYLPIIEASGLLQSPSWNLRTSNCGRMCYKNWLISAWWVQLHSLVMLTLKNYQCVKWLMVRLPTYIYFTAPFAEWWARPPQARHFSTRQLMVGGNAFAFTSGQPIKCARRVQCCGRAYKMHRNLDTNYSYGGCWCWGLSLCEISPLFIVFVR